MLLRWIKGLTNKETPNLEQPAGKDSSVSIDVAQKAMEYQAMHRRKELEGLIAQGWPAIKKKKLKGKIRQKVWEKVKDSQIFADEEIVEEITEKISEASENDPYYKKAFGE